MTRVVVRRPSESDVGKRVYPLPKVDGTFRGQSWNSAVDHLPSALGFSSLRANVITGEEVLHGLPCVRCDQLTGRAEP